jgi:ubiquinol-cytochrome c reductase iron-sulfur subunit
MGGALGLFAVPLVLQVAGSLGPMPQKSLSRTFWNGGPSGPGEDPEFRPLRLMRDPDGTPVKAEDVTIGSVFTSCPRACCPTRTTRRRVPRGSTSWRRRPRPPSSSSGSTKTLIESQKQRDWGYHGIVAYSKICTHAGCPVGLYEQQTHHLLCPCHQSTFDVTNDCEVIFGPARRALPQLKITVDKDGYLIADDGFAEPVGPSFWTRKR